MKIKKVSVCVQEVFRASGAGFEPRPNKIADSSILLKLLRKKRSSDLDVCFEDIKNRVNKKIGESDPSGSFDTMRLLVLTEEKEIYREILVRHYYNDQLTEAINGALGIALNGDTEYSCSNGSKTFLRLTSMDYWYYLKSPTQAASSSSPKPPTSGATAKEQSGPGSLPSSPMPGAIGEEQSVSGSLPKLPMPAATAEQQPISGGPSSQEVVPRFTAQQLDIAAYKIIESLAHHYNEDPKAIAATINQNTIALAQRRDGSLVMAENFVRFKDNTNNFSNTKRCTSAACSYGDFGR